MSDPLPQIHDDCLGTTNTAMQFKTEFMPQEQITNRKTQRPTVERPKSGLACVVRHRGLRESVLATFTRPHLTFESNEVSSQIHIHIYLHNRKVSVHKLAEVVSTLKNLWLTLHKISSEHFVKSVFLVFPVFPMLTTQAVLTKSLFL
uniref:Uncharacterized protein n=1 Tax=Physcomitrium patens TaxID=3218 RepID=A0A2K1JR68_PHYPA|nr:hypothetical protein PHYPA_016417 [Physcomitrium patens]